jgi:hypothetical protein
LFAGRTTRKEFYLDSDTALCSSNHCQLNKGSTTNQYLPTKRIGFGEQALAVTD